MKTNVEKLRELYALGDIRQRLGADNSRDESYDDKINKMSNSEIVEAYSGWHLGTGDWWVSLKSIFDELEQNDE